MYIAYIFRLLHIYPIPCSLAFLPQMSLNALHLDLAIFYLMSNLYILINLWLWFAPLGGEIDADVMVAASED